MIDDRKRETPAAAAAAIRWSWFLNYRGGFDHDNVRLARPLGRSLAAKS